MMTYFPVSPFNAGNSVSLPLRPRQGERVPLLKEELSVCTWYQPYSFSYPLLHWERLNSKNNHVTYGNVLSAIYTMEGNELLANGTWKQYPANYDATIKIQAHQHGNLYMPLVFITSRVAFETVLDNPVLSQLAIDNLVILATTRPFDSPWDGVDFDIEGMYETYKVKLTNWLSTATTALHNVGLKVNITVTGSDRDAGLPTWRHCFDYGAINAFTDAMTVMLYSSWLMTPNTAPGPYDLADRVLAYILSKGVDPEKLYAGFTVTSVYYPNVAIPTTLYFTSYASAMATLAAAGQTATWYEANPAGQLYRFKHAAWGIEEMWVTDEETLAAHLTLVNKYDLAGASLFILGSEDTDIWRTIECWRRPS